ncbi:hypothetical protein Tco_1460718 [Tanacetum coccineum]
MSRFSWRVLGNARFPRIRIRIKRSWGVAVVVPFVMPSQNIAKLIGFTMDDDPIVEVDMGHEIANTLAVYDLPSQEFHTLGTVGNGGSFFIGPYKESLILVNV